MVNYSLEEFKAWLKEENRRNRNIIHPLNSGTRAMESWFTTILPSVEGAEDNWVYYLRQKSHGINWVVDKWLTGIFQWEEQIQLADRIVNQKQVKITQLEQELITERETAQQALTTSQEWHERQKAEIIAQWKGKLTNFLNARKQKLQQEIQLIKEVLND